MKKNETTLEERKQAVETATSVSMMDGYNENNDFLNDFVDNKKSIDEVIDEILKS